MLIVLSSRRTNIHSMQQHANGLSMRQHARQACNNMQRMVLNQYGQLSNRPKSAANMLRDEGQSHIQTCMYNGPTLKHERATFKDT